MQQVLVLLAGLVPENVAQVVSSGISVAQRELQRTRDSVQSPRVLWSAQSSSDVRTGQLERIGNPLAEREQSLKMLVRVDTRRRLGVRCILLPRPNALCTDGDSGVHS